MKKTTKYTMLTLGGLAASGLLFFATSKFLGVVGENSLSAHHWMEKQMQYASIYAGIKTGALQVADVEEDMAIAKESAEREAQKQAALASEYAEREFAQFQADVRNGVKPQPRKKTPSQQDKQRLTQLMDVAQ